MTAPGEGSGPMSRWLAVLQAYEEHDEWGVRELTRHTGLPRSTIHRILHDMEHLGLLQVSATNPGRFAPGPSLIRLATLLAKRVDVVRVARPVLEATTNQCRETTILALYDPRRRQFYAADAVESTHPVRYIWNALRDWSQVHLGSSGKGILAFLPEAEQAAIVADLPDPIPGLKPVSKAQLIAQLEDIRRLGFVISHSERYEGAIGAAAPVYDAHGRVLGDIIITWPASRSSPDREGELGELVRTAAATVSTRIGYTS